MALTGYPADKIKYVKGKVEHDLARSRARRGELDALYDTRLV